MKEASKLGYFLPMRGDKVRACSLAEFAWFWERRERFLANDQVGSFRVSTVFLGLDHNFGGGVPHLWETMIFVGRRRAEPRDFRERGISLDESAVSITWRYSRKSEALRNHGAVVDMIRAGLS